MTDTSSPSLPRKRRRSLAQQVVDDLASRIRAGEYRPGDKLPTEPDVMAQQGVSRTVVREAMSRLQASGLVATRHGVGTFVLDASASWPLDMGTVATIRDTLAMLELRVSLETEAAGLAALRRNDVQLAAMRAAVQAFDDDIARGGDAIGADFDFHVQIALATGNRYFENILRHLGTTTIPRTRIDTPRLVSESGPSYLQRSNREHEEILEAVARRDPEGAQAAMRMHLTNSRERLRRASEETSGA